MPHFYKSVFPNQNKLFYILDGLLQKCTLSLTHTQIIFVQMSASVVLDPIAFHSHWKQSFVIHRKKGAHTGLENEHLCYMVLKFEVSIKVVSDMAKLNHDLR